MPTQAYRLVVKEADGVTNDFVITSIRGGTNPYIASVPSGDGQEVDLLTGAVRTGAYVVEVVDVVTGTDGTGTLRIVTNQLYDPTNTNQVHLLSRRAFVDMSTDNGVSWTTWQAGYLTSIEQIDAIRYAFTISNTRRIEQTLSVFTWATAAERTAFPNRGCIFGGPVVGGFGAKPDGTNISMDSGGWEFSLVASATVPSLNKLTSIVSLDFTAAYLAPLYQRQTTITAKDLDTTYSALNPFLQYDTPNAVPVGADFAGLNDRAPVFAYPRVVVQLKDLATGNTWTGRIRGLFTSSYATSTYTTYGTSGDKRMFIELDDASTTSLGVPTPALPSAGTILRVRAYSDQVTPQAPVYFDLHPVEVVTRLYDIANISYESDTTAPYTVGSWQWMREQMGENIRIAARITEPSILAEFLEKAIFGPFGFATRTNGDGKQEFFSTRELGGNIDYTIATADIVGDEPAAIWALDESTAVTGFTIQQRQLTPWVQGPNTDETPPPDNITETAQPLQYLNGDTTTFSTRMVEYDIPGMVHDKAGFVPNIETLGLAIAREGFDRFGRGAAISTVQVLRTSAAAAAKVGDLVYITASYYPNKNYRIGESSVGARVAQIVRRDELPEGPVFKLVDAGVSNQPATAPTITIAASTSDPRRVAEFTITNATTLNTAANLSVAIEYGTGTNAPTANSLAFTRYTPANIPTSAVPLPPMVPGTKVWVRARTEQAGRFPSAWTAWTNPGASVTLTAWIVPNAVTVTNLTNASAVVSWDLGSPTDNTTDPIDVYVAPGSVAPSDWQIYRVNTLPAGTTSTRVLNLTASTNYIVGVAFRDFISNARGTVATQTFTTTASTSGTAPTPIGLQVVPGIDDVTSPQGVFLVIYPAPGASQTIVERATTSGGTFTEIAVIPAETTSYVDQLPKNGTTYYYRVKHRVPGQADSTASAEVSGTALGLNVFVIPAYSAPSLKAVTTPGASSYDIVVTWDGTIVYNLDGVSQSVSGWTSPRTVNVTRDTGTATKVAAFAVSKTGVTVSESVNVPPVASSVPAITSAYFDNGFTPGDGGGSVDIIWTVANMPSGVTYNIDLVDVTGDPITDSSAAYTGVTSPYTASIALGDGAEATCVIQALVGGITIAAYSFRSAIPI